MADSKQSTSAADEDARRRNRETTTAGGTPGNTPQAKPTDPAVLEGVTGMASGEVDKTRLPGDPSPGTPDRELSTAQRQERDRLRAEYDRNPDKAKTAASKPTAKKTSSGGESSGGYGGGGTGMGS